MKFIWILLSIVVIINPLSAQPNQTGTENAFRLAQISVNLLERMKYYKVPGVSIAVVNNGRTEWSHGYGYVTNDPKAARVDEQTRFQAASISKCLTAFGALLLVQQGKLSLDEDVNLYLKRWKVPQNGFTKTEKVTLRRLLSHTAGTSIHGFPGYSAGTLIPTAIEILEGKKPVVNTDPVIVTSIPGTELRYSGGGTTIVQVLIEDITGEHFEDWMQNKVLIPLGMLQSTFKQPLPPPHTAHAAYGHYSNGTAIEGKWHNYPEMAAAGLWTTPRDLAQFIIYIQATLKGKKTNLLSRFYVKEMITRQKIGGKSISAGLGLFLKNEGKNLVFDHDGQDEGFIARLSAYAYQGQGIVIMMNNDSAWALMDEIINSVAKINHWPHFKPIKKPRQQ
jgi:CubicO group peptidase (beta-lactamase class C family)